MLFVSSCLLSSHFGNLSLMQQKCKCLIKYLTKVFMSATHLSIQSRYMIPQSYSIFQRQWWKMRHDIAAHNYRNYFPSLFLVTPCGTLKTPSIWRLNTFIKKKRKFCCFCFHSSDVDDENERVKRKNLKIKLAKIKIYGILSEDKRRRKLM